MCPPICGPLPIAIHPDHPTFARALLLSSQQSCQWGLQRRRRGWQVVSVQVDRRVVLAARLDAWPLSLAVCQKHGRRPKRQSVDFTRVGLYLPLVQDRIVDASPRGSGHALPPGCEVLHTLSVAGQPRTCGQHRRIRLGAARFPGEASSTPQSPRTQCMGASGSDCAETVNGAARVEREFCRPALRLPMCETTWAAASGKRTLIVHNGKVLKHVNQFQCREFFAPAALAAQHPGQGRLRWTRCLVGQSAAFPFGWAPLPQLPSEMVCGGDEVSC